MQYASPGDPYNISYKVQTQKPRKSRYKETHETSLKVAVRSTLHVQSCRMPWMQPRQAAFQRTGGYLCSRRALDADK